jgi:enterobactin synthetase component D / holo-[acyl-carrier protein] synthase
MSQFSLSPTQLFRVTTADDSLFSFASNFVIGHVDTCDFEILGILPPENLNRMVDKRRSEFLAGRYCAQKTLIDAGSRNTQVRVGSNNTPYWPFGFVGSLTHCAGLSIAYASKRSDYKNIGVDVEKIMSRDFAQKVSKLVFPEDEKVHDWPLSYESLLTIVFSAKEAVFKAIYHDVGYVFGFDKVKLIKVERSYLILEIGENLSESWVKGDRISIHYEIFGDLVFTLVAIGAKDHCLTPL